MESHAVTLWDSIIQTLSTNAEARGVLSGAMMAALSIPMALVGQVLKVAPDWLVDPAWIPPILAGLGLLAGLAISFYTPLPADLSMAVGMGAGLGAKGVHDIHKKYRPNRITKPEDE